MLASTRYEDQEAEWSIESQIETLLSFKRRIYAEKPHLVTYDGTTSSALNILSPLILSGPTTLGIVYELAERHLPWAQTGLWKALKEQLDGELQEWETNLREEKKSQDALKDRMEDVEGNWLNRKLSEQYSRFEWNKEVLESRFAKLHQLYQRGDQRLELTKVEAEVL